MNFGLLQYKDLDDIKNLSKFITWYKTILKRIFYDMCKSISITDIVKTTNLNIPSTSLR